MRGNVCFWCAVGLSLALGSSAQTYQQMQVQQLQPISSAVSPLQTFTLQDIQLPQAAQLAPVTPPSVARTQQPVMPAYGGYEPEPELPPPQAPPPPPPPTARQSPPSAPTNDQNVLERLTQFCTPGENFDVDRLNVVMNRVGRELHFLSEKSRECLYEKVRSLSQLKRMREGLKNAYKDIYNLQGALGSYQTQLKEMQEYLKNNKNRIVVVDNKQLGDMYSMVRRLQSAAECMVSSCMRPQQPAAQES